MESIKWQPQKMLKSAFFRTACRMPDPDHETELNEEEISRVVSAVDDGVEQEKQRERLNRVLAVDSQALSFYLDLIALRVSMLAVAADSVDLHDEGRTRQAYAENRPTL